MTAEPSQRIRQARGAVISRVVEHLSTQNPGHPLRVAVDGITAAGKTTFAEELAEALRASGRTVIQISGDDFHHQSAHRYRQGRHNPNGYYEDAYDFDAIIRLVLAPLGADADPSYQARHHDLASDALYEENLQPAPADAVVIVEGSFLQRPELAGYWDEVIFVDTSFGEARRRGSLRDVRLFGGLGRAQHAFDTRYHPACQRYLAEVPAAEKATIVIGNERVDRPELRRIGSDAST